MHSIRPVLLERRTLRQLGRNAEADAVLESFLTELHEEEPTRSAWLVTMVLELSSADAGPDCAGAKRVGQEATAREVVLPPQALSRYASACGGPAPPPPAVP